ncbi:MAG: alanine racemase [Candidatus Cloacimonadota bacterium]|nr:MAG: alanine racemase [Candidatus Cloacimonadota bacterium]
MKNDRSWTEIDLTNFEDNISELRKFIKPDTRIMQIVKADAYGHGAYEIARKSIKCGASYLGVANAQEGFLLRYQGIRIPIVILSPSLVNEINIILENDLIPTISSYQFAKELAKQSNRKINIHINIDTGMGRSGFEYDSALKEIDKIKKLPNLFIQGIFSHFSSAENDLEYTEHQNIKFQKFIRNLSEKPELIHIANSSGVVTMNSDYCNLVRIGLLSYGVYSDPQLKEKIKLKPVMSFKTRISQIKTAMENDSIGYNRTFTSSATMKYAILPVGYADGYDFLLSNKGKVLIKNKECDVIGKVSMDMTAIDVRELDVSVGDEVLLLGDQSEMFRAENVVLNYNGSSYELLCQIGRRAKRYYKENGEIISSSPLLRRDFVSLDYSDEKLNTVIETAIEQRLQSKEISNLVYSEFLKRFFAEHDRDIHYRRNFRHYIEFNEHKFAELNQYFQTNTTLTFTKVLQQDYFYVACANEESKLEKYFLRPDVEYRWLIDKNLGSTLFDLTSVKINDIELYHEMKMTDDCLEIRCYHPELKNLKGKEVEFSISTQTFYPKDLHQLAVYLIELTQGAEITFNFGNVLESAEAVPIFSGRSKFPSITCGKNEITISTQTDEWIFPTSGVVFVY